MVKSFGIFCVERGGVEDEDESWHTGYACEGSELQIRCAESTFIHVINANYGRLDSVICNDHQQQQQQQLAADTQPATVDTRCVSPRSLHIVRTRSQRLISTRDNRIWQISPAPAARNS